MTKQEAFDRAVAGLASQGFQRATSAGGSCLYMAGARRCALGWLMPKNLLKRLDRLNELGTPACQIYAKFGQDVPGYTIKDFVAALQLAHDEGITPHTMRHKLINLANLYNLVVPTVLLDT